MKYVDLGTRWGFVQHLWALIGMIWVAGCSSEAASDLSGASGGSGGTGGIGRRPATEEVVEGAEAADSRTLEETSLVAPLAAATSCTANNQCGSGFCVDGFCCDTKCDYKCMACSAAKKGSGADGVCGSIAYDTDPDNDCPVGACDGKNQCKNYNGVSCISAAQCLSNYCVDGVCCGNICMGACQACTATKKGGGYDGVCGSIKAATDPDNECNPGECNGSGACNASPQSTSANGAACTSAAQCQSGYCADGVCCDSWCLGTCMACSAAKKGGGADGTCGYVANDKDFDDECWAGACNGAGACKNYNGMPCTDKTQCLSNYCVDGYCCGNLCTQLCYACSNGKKGYGYDGVCEPIGSGRDQEDECNPGECNGSGSCNQPQTPQANGTTCVAGAQCASGNCVDGVCCDTACASNCTACTTAKKGSGANGVCGYVASATDPDKECGNGKCDGAGVCRYYNGAPCTSTGQCFSNYCVDGVCCGNICTSTCYACSTAKKGYGYDGVCENIAGGRDPDNECNPGECSGSGACNQPQSQQANGTACTIATQCASGFCVDGFCCNTGCTGTCQACSATKKGSGADGTCGNIKYDTDPDNECLVGACSGTGLCQKYNGVACTNTTECLSNYCVDGFCCGNICTQTCYACSAAKKGGSVDGACGPIANNTDPDNECGSTCNGTGACYKAPNGSACLSAAECTSNFCVDGVCCNNACTGSCQACNMLGTEGTCSNSCPGPCTGKVGLPGASIAPLSSLAFDAYGAPGEFYGFSMVSADFDQDGLADAALANSSLHAVSVLFGQNTATFAAQVEYPTGNYPQAVAVGDLNGDGKPDLAATSSYSGNGVVSILLNQGNGTFAAKVDYSIGSWPSGIAIADFNADGKLDVAAANGGSSTVSVLFGQGNGTFGAAANYATGSGARGLAAGDFNGDGKPDLAVTNSFADNVSVLLNLGNGTFAPKVDYPTARFPESIVATDLNGDGKADLATANNSGSESSLSVLMNQGNGTFSPKVDLTTPYGDVVIAADFNADGKPDLAAPNAFPASASVFLNQGNGTFASRVDYGTRGHSRAMAAGDVNGDGRLDMIVANALRSSPTMVAGSMSVVINSGNGVFNTPLVQTPSFAADSTAVAAADLNGDSKLDIISADNSNSALAVYMAQTNSTWGAKIPITLGANPNKVAAAELNGAPGIDLAVQTVRLDPMTNLYGDFLTLLMNQGNGTFAPKIDVAIEKGTQDLVTADFNGDGKLDFASTYWRTTQIDPPFGPFIPSNGATVRLNAGNGTILSTSNVDLSILETYNQDSTNRLAVGDFNGDANLDLALISSNSNELRLLTNQGNGTIVASPAISVTAPRAIAAADVNGDGYVDLLCGTTNGTRLFLNNGSGTFTAGTNPNSGILVEVLKPVDLNGDGFVDITFAAYSGSTIFAQLGQGNGAFGPVLEYPTGSGPYDIATGDLNNDGRTDLLVAAFYSDFAHAMLNQCLP